MDIDQAKIDLSGDMAAPAQSAATNVSRSGIVDELAELRERVDQAIERLETWQVARRRQSQGLMTRQTDLEAKFEARSEELDHCGRRIEALTRENADLMGMVDRLVQIVDDTASDLVAASAENKQITEPSEAPVNELVSSIDDEPDRQQNTELPLFRLIRLVRKEVSMGKYLDRARRALEAYDNQAPHAPSRTTN